MLTLDRLTDIERELHCEERPSTHDCLALVQMARDSIEARAALAAAHEEAEHLASSARDHLQALITARAELERCRAIVEEHRKAAKAENFRAWTAYNDGAEDALNRLSDALSAALGGGESGGVLAPVKGGERG